MPNTLPEGVTPPPILFPQAPPARPFYLLNLVSALVGIIIGIGIVLSGLGKAFYVERSEYTSKNEQDARDKTTVAEVLKGVNARFDRQDLFLSRMENKLENLGLDLQSFKVETARRMR